MFNKGSARRQQQSSSESAPLNEVGFLARLGFKPWLTKRRRLQRIAAWEESKDKLAQMRGDQDSS